MPDTATVLITGVTGSFGSAMLRHLLRTSSCTIRGLSRGELLQAQLWQSLTPEEQSRVRLLIGDVRDQERLQLALHGVETVYHAAALKRVDAGEYDPQEFAQTNVWGTSNMVRACIANRVRRAIFLSSDKSASPVNTYGSTKMLAERLWIRANSYAPVGTDFVCTRYGNVVGSRGSVFDIWQRCKAAGDPLPITHKAMSRFWITLEAAVKLAEFAAAHAMKGTILVPHLAAYRVPDLAHAYGGDGVKTVDIGIRPGEKFHEELIAQHELTRVVATHPFAPYAYAILPEKPSWPVQALPGETWYPFTFHERYESGQWPHRLDAATLREQLQQLGVV